MTPAEFAIKIREFNNWLQTSLHKDATVVGAMTMAAQINNRVEQKGVNSKGNAFKGYSTKDTLVGPGSFERKASWEKVLAQANSDKEEDAAVHWISLPILSRGFALRTHLIVLPGGYKKIRELDGLQTAHKDFSRTRMMWKWFGIKAETKSSVRLGGKTKESQDKINWNTAREKDVIIYPSDKEIDQLADYVLEVVAAKFNAL